MASQVCEGKLANYCTGDHKQKNKKILVRCYCMSSVQYMVRVFISIKEWIGLLERVYYLQYSDNRWNLSPSLHFSKYPRFQVYRWEGLVVCNSAKRQKAKTMETLVVKTKVVLVVVLPFILAISWELLAPFTQKQFKVVYKMTII